MTNISKKYLIYIPIVISIAFAGGLYLGNHLNYFQNLNAGKKSVAKSKINTLIDFIEKDYVDQVNTDSIVDLTVTGILDKLDPHSVYIPKSELASENEEMQGSFVGIGISFQMLRDSLCILNVLPNGPSKKAGLKAGDRILFANKKQLFSRNLNSNSIFPILKGKLGSKVDLVVYRKTENKNLKITLTRDHVAVNSVENFTLLNQNLGYVKVNKFAEKTYSEFKNALLQLKKSGAKDIVIDLRGNGGGLMDMAIQMADEFLPNKDLIVKMKNKKGQSDLLYATSGGIFETGKLYVLIDENSASASEIFAGAIQDNDRGTIVGRRSFGKGLVQRELVMEDGSAVRLTIARYYTPSGRSIQKPFEDDKQKYFNDFEQRFKNGELYSKDSIKVADSLKYKTKKGRIVYGGGGIIPDIFVPIAGSKNSLSEFIWNQNIYGNFVFESIDKDRKYFEKFDLNALKQEVFSNKKYLNELKTYFNNQGIDIDLKSKKDKILHFVQAEFARQLFGENDYFKLILPFDPMIEKINNTK